MSLLSTQHTLQAYYLGLFGRAADPDGLNYWLSQLESGTLALDDALMLMANSDEFSERLQLPADDDWLAQVYPAYFGRPVDAEGGGYWSSLAAQGVSAPVLLQSIMASATGADREALDATTSIARFYSQQVSPERYDPAQTLIQEGLRSNEALYADLAAMDAQFDALTVTEVGESLEGRPLYSASVGNGPRKLMIVTQQHGDEPTGTEAAMLLLEWLSGDSPEAQWLRSEISLTVMPRVNPDGFERWVQLASGEASPDTTIDPRRNSADIDLNRTWDSSETLDLALIPETLAVRQEIARFQPDLILDYHNQNNYINAAGELETISILWPTNDLIDDQVTATAQQAAVALAQGVAEFDYGFLSLFPGGDTPQIARNGLAIDGVPTLLIEQRGLEEMELIAYEGLAVNYNALSSALILEGLMSMIGVITELGSGGLTDIDPALALQIPDRGERIQYQDIYTLSDEPIDTEGMPPETELQPEVVGVSAAVLDDALVA